MTKDFYKGRKAMVTLETSTFFGWIGEIVDDSEYPVLVIKMQRTEKTLRFRIDALDVAMSEEVKLSEDLEKVLQVFAKTLVAIKRQYTHDHIYNFVVGARDMCMEFVADQPFQERMAFAKRVSQIRLVVFPES